jgi:GntR family transcriptional regulator
MDEPKLGGQMEAKSNIPYYHSVAETLKRRIIDLEYEEGQIIPSEKELSKEFNVSNITIKKALSILANQYLVSRKRGVGTQVIYQEKKRMPIKVSSNFRDLFQWQTNYPTETKTLDISLTTCSLRVRNILGFKPNEQVLRIRRIRKSNKEIISYYVNYTLPHLMPKIAKNELEKDSFIKKFQEISKIKILKVEQQTEAIIADIDLSSILGTQFGDPILFIENIYYSSNDTPVELTHMFFRSDRFVLKTSFKL